MALLVGELRSVLDLDTRKFDQGIDQSHAKFGKFVKSAAIASAAAAVAAGAGLLKLAKGAAEDEAAQKVLATTLKNTAHATDAQVKSIEDYISKTGAATGVTDDEMRPALANLVRATHDVGKAQSLMGLAMDVSAGTGKDLGAVSLALAKAQNGNVGGLGRLGIATKDASGKTKSFTQIQSDLSAMFKGQAAAAADTLQGKYKRSTLTLSEMGETIGAKALPVLATLANVALNDVFPAMGKLGSGLQAVAGFVQRNQTTFKVLAVILGLVAAATAAHTLVLAINSGALRAWFVQTKIVQAATKAWAAVQWLLNIALSANPIGLVIAAMVLFGLGLVALWRKSSTFRSIVTAAFNGIKSVALTVITFVWNLIAGFFGNLLTGAAKAFGWVPGLGPKLKSAAKWFGEFKDSVNSKLNGLKDQEIKISPIVLAAQQARRSSVERRLGNTYAGGGPITGPGTGTSDDVPLWGSNGEHVWTAEEVRKAGGHGAVMQMRRAVRGYAKGGPVGFNVRTVAPPLEGPMDSIARVAVAVARPIAQALGNKLAASLGPGGPPGSVHSFRGERLNTRTIQMLLAAERLLGRVFHIFQGSYSTRVGASAGTHAGGGAMDTDGAGNWAAGQAALRRVGFAAWIRYPWQGPWGQHIHSIARGDSSASAAAKAQVRDFLRGGNGLRGYANGTPYVPFDQFAFVHRGEAIVPANVNRRRLAAVGSGGIHFHLEGAIIASEQQALDWLTRGVDKLKRQRRI